MPVIYVPRVWGGTLILNIAAPSVPVPSLLIQATFRDGEQKAVYRDGEQVATHRDGIVQTGGR